MFLSDLGLVRFACPPRWAEAIYLTLYLGCLQIMLRVAEDLLLITVGQLLDADGEDANQRAL